jgi:ADP-heptose:LPS heptosyltransferase
MIDPKQRILVVRFSALGDVVMTVPVVKAFLSAHPRSEIIMLSEYEKRVVALSIIMLYNDLGLEENLV